MSSTITTAPFSRPQHAIHKRIPINTEFDAGALGKVIVGFSVRVDGKVAGLAVEGDDLLASGVYSGATDTVGEAVTVLDGYFAGNYSKIKTGSTAVVYAYVTDK